MKQIKILLGSLLIIAPVFSTLAMPKTATGCEAKRLNIEQQIDYARTYGNTHRIKGLEKALSEVSANCTDETLRADRESTVRKKEIKVEQRRLELAEAQSDGRTDKILKKQRKLKEAQDELKKARAMLTK